MSLRYESKRRTRGYCDRDTRIDVVDALALLRTRPVRAAGRASSAAQRARQNDAFKRKERDWLVTGAAGAAPPSRGVSEAAPRLTASCTAPVARHGRYDKRRFEAALASRAAAPASQLHPASHGLGQVDARRP